MGPFDEAAAFAQLHEIPWPRDPAAEPGRWGVHHDDPPPFNRLRGPVHPRGGVSGVIRVRGEEKAAWGEPDRADQTYSVAKTYLALLAGIAHARGLLDPAERVSDRLPGIGFDTEHNRRITWEHLLTQTSEWQGECFGMPDWVEHNRRVSHDPKPPTARKGERRVLQPPGTHWEYNDVRINQLSLALLHLFGKPLPEIFLESVLRPIGGGDFRWEGYDDAWVEIGGRRMQSVPGGTHWGGGVSISARDQARIGQLLLDGASTRAGKYFHANGCSECTTLVRPRRSTGGSRGSTPTGASSPMRRERASSCSAPAGTRCGSTRTTKRSSWHAGWTVRIPEGS